ncbi:MAG: amino acid adenylation domain-containing protein [Clostridium sp.]|jgi:amino acid adenylation domain-containing protein|nr:amino acid adenylation domain-containing protein [Clostridium sp.]
MQAKIEKRNLEDMLPLSPMQEGMLFQYLNDRNSRMYYEQMSLLVHNRVDAGIFEKAWRHVIHTNEMLRTVYRWENLKAPVQVVLKEQPAGIDRFDLSGLEEGKKRDQIKWLKEEMFREGLDLGTQALKIALLKLEDERYEIIVYRHQIIYDGWSNGILLKELFEAYAVLQAGGLPEEKTKRTYKEHVNWLLRQPKEEAADYWRGYLRGFDTKTTLPYGAKRNAGMRAAEYSLPLSARLSERIETFIREHHLTLAALSYTAYGILLQRYHHAEDVVFGTTVSGRKAEIDGMEHVIGMFLSTLPMRIQASPDTSGKELLGEVMDVLARRSRYDTLPMSDIRKCSMIPGMEPLFDSVLILENYPLDELVRKAENGLRAELVSMTEQTDFDLTIQILTHDAIVLKFLYHANAFAPGVIERLAGHFANLLERLTDAPETKVSKIEILTGEEREQLLRKFNDTSRPYPKDRMIHQLFSGQAEKTPDKTAVICGGESITYRQLEERSDRLAGTLRKAGIGRQQMVGIYLPRCVDMIVGILGVLKVGGVYVPLDIGHPSDRTDDILKDSTARVLLQSERRPYQGNFNGTVLNIEMVPDPCGGGDNGRAMADQSASGSIACLIYTSGSTGKPKGVLLPHSGIVNHGLTKAEELDIQENDVVGNNFSINVVASIWQIFVPLMLGATLVVYGEEVEKDPYLQFECLARDGISIIQLIPSVLNVYLWLMEKGKKKVVLERLRKIALTSEEVKASLVERFYHHYDIPLVNCYGQTECCDDTLHYLIPANAAMETVPIGRPSLNTQAYILSGGHCLQPQGVTGELYISGDGVSRGYWKLPELTKEKFLDHPFEPGKKLYATGDLARWNASGYVEYLGRADHQVKIRGNRIEPGEIENLLLKHGEIENAAVICRTDEYGEPYLCAYLMARKELTVGELNHYLRRWLPDSMIPSRFIRLDEFPLTPNGKVDRKRLPASAAHLNTGERFVRPQSAVEKELEKIWGGLLSRGDIGVNDSFFELGGNSLLLIRLREAIAEAFHIEVSVQDLFAYPTMMELARFISIGTGGETKRAMRGMKIRESYRSLGTREAGAHTYTYHLKGDSYTRLQQAARRKEADCFTILTALYMVMLARMAKEDRVEVFGAFQDSDQIMRIQAKASEIQDFDQLLAVVHPEKPGLAKAGMTPLEPERLEPCQAQDAIAPLIYDKYQSLMKTDYFKLFDMALGVETGKHQLILMFEHGGQKLDPGKMKQCFHAYLRSVQQMPWAEI